MDIFHEKQQGSLCAQHCLNALLQAPIFSIEELNTLAHELDEEERKRMAENGTETEDYKKFLRQTSHNMDDRGFFSIQVINKALAVWDLELIGLNSNDDRAKRASRDPDLMDAYICNHHEHWITIRKIRGIWYNLNSVLPGPKLLTTTYLSLFLAQLLNDGYSIFIVWGTLPVFDRNVFSIQSAITDNHEIEGTNDSKLNEILEQSLVDYYDDPNMDEKERIQRAIQMSLENDY